MGPAYHKGVPCPWVPGITLDIIISFPQILVGGHLAILDFDVPLRRVSFSTERVVLTGEICFGLEVFLREENEKGSSAQS